MMLTGIMPASQAATINRALNSASSVSSPCHNRPLPNIARPPTYEVFSPSPRGRSCRAVSRGGGRSANTSVQFEQHQSTMVRVVVVLLCLLCLRGRDLKFCPKPIRRRCNRRSTRRGGNMCNLDRRANPHSATIYRGRCTRTRSSIQRPAEYTMPGVLQRGKRMRRGNEKC